MFLEKPSAQLCSQVKELEYISDVGGEWDLGTIMAGNAEAGWCVYSDETKFNKIDTPAYTDLAGNSLGYLYFQWSPVVILLSNLCLLYTSRPFLKNPGLFTVLTRGWSSTAI